MDRIGRAMGANAADFGGCALIWPEWPNVMGTMASVVAAVVSLDFHAARIQ